jgi:hypothetical protein
VATWRCCDTKPTYFFHAGESETNDEDTDTVANTTSIVAVGKPMEGSISTLGTEIAELDKIGFDETLVLDESLDIWYIIDAEFEREYRGGNPCRLFSIFERASLNIRKFLRNWGNYRSSKTNIY